MGRFFKAEKQPGIGMSLCLSNAALRIEMKMCKMLLYKVLSW